jgi:hypothetical protein
MDPRAVFKLELYLTSVSVLFHERMTNTRVFYGHARLPTVLLSVFALASTFLPAAAEASYSPPLTRVRIDENLTHHTPSIVIAQQTFVSDPISLDLNVTGLQYLGQFERDSGLGFQLGLAGGYANLTGNFSKLSSILPKGSLIDAKGSFVGWQLRSYYMLWKSKAESQKRPHAITGFLNVRGVYYDTDDANAWVPVNLRSNTVTGGIGAMAEFSIHDYISICPYGWITPHFYTKLRYGTDSLPFERIEKPHLRNPLLLGIDVWIYPFPPNWHDHISLSILGSFIDTEDRGEKFFAGVIGYTF